MRDATFMLQALHWLHLDGEADEFMQFVADVKTTEDGSLQIMYGIDGRRELPESTRADLSGYAGARPVPQDRTGRGRGVRRERFEFPRWYRIFAGRCCTSEAGATRRFSPSKPIVDLESRYERGPEQSPKPSSWRHCFCVAQ
jgi:hypothetical protein